MLPINNLISQQAVPPKITIVTPSYNQAGFLENTILSVLNQNYPNLEYMIIDGGSTDGSVNIIKKYEKYLTYWISEKDNGQSHAIMKGFDRASGDILGWLNSDDILLPGTLMRVAQLFREDPDLALIYGNIIYIDHNNTRVGERRFVPFKLRTLLTDCGISQPATFWTKKVYTQTGGLNAKYTFCMDYDLFVRIAMAGKVKYIRNFLAGVRLHSDTKTSNLHHIYLKERKEIRSKYYPCVNNPLILAMHRLYAQAYRVISYAFQGDAHYLINQIINRIKR